MFVTVSSKAGVRWFKLLLPFRILMRLFSYVFIIFIREEVSLLQTAHFPWGPGTSLHGRSRIGLWRLAGAVGGGRAQRQVWRETRAPFFFFLCFFPLPSFHPFPVFWNLFFTSHFALLSAAKRAAWRPWMVPNRNTVVGSERTTASRNSRRTSRRRFESSAWKVRPGWEFWTFWKKVLCIGYSGYIL